MSGGVRHANVGLAGLAVLALATAGCGSQVSPTPGAGSVTPGAGGQGGDAATTSAPAAPAADGTTEYVTWATVLDDGDGPEVCLGGQMDSLPPQCGGPPVNGWDWDDVEHEESGGVRWVEGMRVIGTFDGTAFTLTRPAEPSEDAEDLPGMTPPEFGRDFAPLCDDPYRGGDEGAEQGPEVMAELDALLRSTEGYVEHYVSDGTDDINVVVTGDADPEVVHAQVREIWSGFLCVEHQDVASEADVRAAQDAVTELEDAGILSVGGAGGRLEVGVVLADQATLDAVHEAAAPWLTPDQIDLFASLLPVPLEAQETD